MSTIATKDGARIFCTDWGTGQPVLFSHGWPLTADAWARPEAAELAKLYALVAPHCAARGAQR